MGSISGWHVLVIVVVLGVFGGLAFLVAKSKGNKPTRRILGGIVGVAVILVLLRMVDSYFAEPLRASQRSFSQARENVSRYTNEQRDYFERYISTLGVQGYILGHCLHEMGHGTSSGLEAFNKSYGEIIKLGKDKGVLNDDMLMDADALVKGAIEIRGGLITESDCAGAMNYLGSLGMLTD